MPDDFDDTQRHQLAQAKTLVDIIESRRSEFDRMSEEEAVDFLVAQLVENATRNRCSSGPSLKAGRRKQRPLKTSARQPNHPCVVTVQ